ncbi:MAG: hypothetical protein QM820_37690 [Minicystis sp.]
MLLVAVAGLGPAIGCDLVLGELPPVKQHPGSGGAAGGTAGTGGGVSGSGGAVVGSGGATASSGGAAGSGGECCDCDGDQAGAVGLCGGSDCDDHDPDVYLGQTKYFGQPSANPAIGFDYDCSGKAEQNPDLQKTVDCGLIGLPCAAGEGFLAKVPPACGESAPWGTCKQNGLGCVSAVIEQKKVMTCK